ncbi:hypothetical protein [Kingella sp. (in: b-proteobacteria)]|uniref:hypothetical protein n=1 Tax=Kingella sp. (in: b-proteobacteria) TaxID=2020713 RepID=UPI0026DB9E69|nr:hypothetical protein [Kingella sp. (in: b-proteobacteria)]MDO4658262.1 hypothetical protein [Kingella sp. (in: b-proteobacteria)]
MGDGFSGCLARCIAGFQAACEVLIGLNDYLNSDAGKCPFGFFRLPIGSAIT